MSRVWQILLIVSLLLLSWLMMQVVHEAGHVAMSYCTGGRVAQVVLHPLVISRTDLLVNPHPLAVVWGGPVFGAFLPFVVWLCSKFIHFKYVFLLRFFAGFALVANGAYIGAGYWLADESDCRIMLENGSPLWLLVLFGLICVAGGLFLWHRQGRYFGLGHEAISVKPAEALVTIAMLGLVVACELVFN